MPSGVPPALSPLPPPPTRATHLAPTHTPSESSRALKKNKMPGTSLTTRRASHNDAPRRALATKETRLRSNQAGVSPLSALSTAGDESYWHVSDENPQLGSWERMGCQMKGKEKTPRQQTDRKTETIWASIFVDLTGLHQTNSRSYYVMLSHANYELDTFTGIVYVCVYIYRYCMVYVFWQCMG